MTCPVVLRITRQKTVINASGRAVVLRIEQRQPPILRVTTQPVVLRPEITKVILRTSPQGPPGPGGDVPYTIQAAEVIVPGNPVFLDLTTGELRLAQADAFTESQVFGIAITGAAIGFTADVKAIGKLQLADWTAIVGSATLTRGRDYYLSELTAGMLTLTVPQTSGDFVVRAGRAATTDTLEIHVHRSIRKA